MHWAHQALVLAVVWSLAWVWGCGNPGEGEKKPAASGMLQGGVAMTIQLSSRAFEDGEAIPAKFTADGQNVSPPLSWANVPKGARELALVVEDPDAPSREPFVHWEVYKLPANASELPEGVPHQPKLKNGEMQGKNSFGKVGYDGPAPPRGHGVHHYHFHLYALDQPLNVQAGLTREALAKAMSGHVLAEGELIGTYHR